LIGGLLFSAVCDLAACFNDVFLENDMAEKKRTRRNTLERRCLGKTFKRLFVGAPKGIFKMLEKVKKA
jgi:hypothetical protein